MCAPTIHQHAQTRGIDNPLTCRGSAAVRKSVPSNQLPDTPPPRRWREFSPLDSRELPLPTYDGYKSESANQGWRAATPAPLLSSRTLNTEIRWRTARNVASSVTFPVGTRLQTGSLSQRAVASDLRQRGGPSEPGPAPGFSLPGFGSDPETTPIVTQLMKMKINRDESCLSGGILVASAGVARF